MDSVDNNQVILILGDNRIRANRDKLAKHSLYFSSLFSENFNDHRQNEYPINYGVSLDTLKDFVKWAEDTKHNDPKIQTHYKVEKCMEKFTNTHNSNPLELLELSVVFMCEKLTNDLTSIIILHWLYAEKIIEIWTLAQELGLDKLRDVALGACLDRFEELPYSSLSELTLENLLKLVGNVNVSCSRRWLRFIAKEAVQHHSASAEHDPSSHLYKSLLQIAEGPVDTCPNSIKNRPKYVSCVVAHKSMGDKGKIPCVYWWRNSKFTELVDLKDIASIMDNGKEVFGRQVIGRGFSIYVIGGEQGLGSGRFTKTIWRYCLLSKTWFSVAEMPRPRRHMAVAFIKNKLYLIGGIGQHRLKLSSVDVLDIHTGLWSKAAEIPEMFTEVPASCVVDEKLIYFKTNFYVYDPIIDEWQAIKKSSCDGSSGLNHVDSLISYEDNTCCNDNNVYVGIADSDNQRTLLSRFSLDSTSGRLRFICEQSCDFPRQIFNGSMLFSFSHSNGEVKVERGTLESINSYQFMGICSTIVKSIHESGFQSRIGCFNVIDPATLHQQISFTDQVCINV
ncbi:uncharacterized protein LOC135170980 [Diachasmimorpha longicaudata]|uniref:uncharacterized protein LOC135170980 n=1 Tax=Diachasmimorpha longicaudata TaxID=58733 RepID=UPI0030B87E53